MSTFPLELQKENYLKKHTFDPPKCQRPYHAEYTSSRPITEVKQRRAQSVLGWVTAWEHWVLLALLFLFLFTFVQYLELYVNFSP